MTMDVEREREPSKDEPHIPCLLPNYIPETSSSTTRRGGGITLLLSLSVEQ